MFLLRKVSEFPDGFLWLHDGKSTKNPRVGWLCPAPPYFIWALFHRWVLSQVTQMWWSFSTLADQHPSHPSGEVNDRVLTLWLCQNWKKTLWCHQTWLSQWKFSGTYISITGDIILYNAIPSGYVKIAMENGHWNSGFFPWKNGGSFHGYVTNYQRVNPWEMAIENSLSEVDFAGIFEQNGRFSPPELWGPAAMAVFFVVWAPILPNRIP